MRASAFINSTPHASMIHTAVNLLTRRAHKIQWHRWNSITRRMSFIWVTILPFNGKRACRARNGGRVQCWNALLQHLAVVYLTFVLLLRTADPGTEAFRLHLVPRPTPMRRSTHTDISNHRQKLSSAMMSATETSSTRTGDDRDASRNSANDLLEVPKDDTFPIRESFRELRAGTSPSIRRGKRYDYFNSKTGGIWKSRILGFIPATVC